MQTKHRRAIVEYSSQLVMSVTERENARIVCACQWGAPCPLPLQVGSSPPAYWNVFVLRGRRGKGIPPKADRSCNSGVGEKLRFRDAGPPSRFDGLQIRIYHSFHCALTGINVHRSYLRDRYQLIDDVRNFSQY